MFQMKITKDGLKGIEPVPNGLYDVRLTGFKPTASKLKPGETEMTSVNLWPTVEILNRPDLNFKDGKPRNLKCFNMNTKMESSINDFVHSFGLEMEDQLGDTPAIPGLWGESKPGFDATKPETWVYEGPLLGKTAQWDIVIGDYQGRPNNQVMRFVCKVPDCATKFPSIFHSTKLAKI